MVFPLFRLKENRIGQPLLFRQGEGTEPGVGNSHAAAFHGNIGDSLNPAVSENLSVRIMFSSGRRR